jgi:hypothetical protein
VRIGQGNYCSIDIIPSQPGPINDFARADSA